LGPTSAVTNKRYFINFEIPDDFMFEPADEQTLKSIMKQFGVRKSVFESVIFSHNSDAGYFGDPRGITHIRCVTTNENEYLILLLKLAKHIIDSGVVDN